MKEKIVLAGGGISGLLSAYLLSEKSKYEIHVIEKSDKVGGLLKCFDYKEFGKFDYGAHNIIETGIEELDSILFNLLPEEEWHISSAINGQRRALTGINFNNNLQKNSPFIDLRFHKDIDKFRIDFLKNFEKNKPVNKTTAYAYAKSLFGKLITKKAIVPIFKSLYGVHPLKMDYMAIFLTPLTRVGLFDKITSLELLNSPRLSSLLAFPEQRDLSSKFVGSKKVFYPKKYGMYRVINALYEKLKERGVIFHLNNEITKINVLNDKINTIEIKDSELKNINKVFWTVGLYPLSKLLNIDSKSLSFDAAPKTVITNILINKKSKLNDLSYMYNYDKKYKTFRIDNYINYCSGAKRKDLYPISVEMLLDTETCKDKNKIKTLVLKELKELKVLKKYTKIPFIETEILETGFPLLSKVNVESMDTLRERIKDVKIKNLDTIGVLAEKDLFFEGDIQKDLFKKIKDYYYDN